MKIVKKSQLFEYIVTCILNSTVGIIDSYERTPILYIDTNARIAFHNELIRNLNQKDYAHVDENSPTKSNGFFIASGLKCNIKSCDMSDNHDLLLITVNGVMISKLKYKDGSWYIINYRNEHCENI